MFDKDVTDYLDAIYKRAVELHKCDVMLKEMEIGDERSKWVSKQVELVKWFMKQGEPLQKKFEPYLKIHWTG